MVCVDSSFLASLYAQEIHSSEAHRRVAQKPQTWITPLNRAELAHAFHYQVFRSRISATEAKLAWSQFEQDCARQVWLQVDLPDAMWETCIDLAKKFGPALGVRTLDSLHVACALELGADKFWTFDERQAKLAEAAGLDTTP
jgi:predicted nucleic acid-binding protein